MGRYDDIIALPHYRSPGRAHMTMRERAAQFSPFAALSGYESAIAEQGRLTEARVELDEQEKELIGRTLRALQRRLPAEAELVYFVPDTKKPGGAYRTAAGQILRIDARTRLITMGDGRVIPIDEVIRLDAGASTP